MNMLWCADCTAVAAAAATFITYLRSLSHAGSSRTARTSTKHGSADVDSVKRQAALALLLVLQLHVHSSSIVRPPWFESNIHYLSMAYEQQSFQRYSHISDSAALYGSVHQEDRMNLEVCTQLFLR
jgi:hypothetical protein